MAIDVWRMSSFMSRTITQPGDAEDESSAIIVYYKSGFLVRAIKNKFGRVSRFSVSSPTIIFSEKI